MPGTKIVGAGEGVTAGELNQAATWWCGYDFLFSFLPSHKTNIALTGEPLNETDLMRIAEAE